MSCLLGDGLPSTVTSERIKEILGFRRSQEREFREALDSAEAPVGSQDDLYRHLHGLLRTASGRETYGEARRLFEDAKSKRLQRADFFLRLRDACLREAKERSEFDTIPDDQPGSVATLDRCQKAFAQSNAWERLAEFVWASSVEREIGDDIVDTMKTYPEVAPFLEEVRKGLVLANGPSAPPSEIPLADSDAAWLVDRIKRAVASLDAERLESATLDSLKKDILHLSEIVEAFASRRRDIERVRSRLSAWLGSHSELLVIAPGLEDRLAMIETRCDAGQVDDDLLTTVLDRCEAAIAIARRVRETRATYDQAYKRDDFASISDLATTLASLQEECDKVYAAVDAALSEPPLEDDGVPDESQTVGSEAAAARVTECGDDGTAADAPKDRGPIPAFVPEAAARPPAEEVPELVDGEPPTVDDEEVGSGRDEREETLTDEPGISRRPGEVSALPAASNGDADISVERIERAVTTAIGRGRFGLAYHLVRAMPGIWPPADAVKLVASNYVTEERESVAADLPVLAAGLNDELRTVLRDGTDLRISHDYAVLIACAALAPARTAPGGPVAELLLSVEPHLGDMPSLRALTNTAANVSMKGTYLTQELLCGDESFDKWTETADALRKETNDWIEAERRTRLRYQAATRVWQRMLTYWEDRRDKPRVSIGHMFALLTETVDDIDIEGIKKIAGYWRNHGDQEIDRIDRDIRSSATVNRIDGRARRDLLGKINEAVVFVDQWRNLLESRADRGPDFRTDLANSLRSTVREHAQATFEEITRLESPAARRAEDLVRRYVAMFKGAPTDTPASHLNLRDLLNGDLLADPRVRLDDTGHPFDDPPAPDLLLQLVVQETPNFIGAARNRAKDGDFSGAEATIDFATRRGFLHEIDADDARTTIDGERERVERELQDKVDNAISRLDSAYVRGVLTAEEFEQLQAKMPPTDFSEIDDFRPIFDNLSRVDAQIDDAAQREHRELKERLKGGKNVPPVAFERIANAIECREFQVAHDFIDRLERGETLPESDAGTDRPIDQFFPSFVKQYIALRKETPDVLDVLRNIRSVIAGRKRDKLIDATKLSEDAAQDAASFIGAWCDLHAEKSTNNRLRLRKLVNALGFTKLQLSPLGRRRADGEMDFLIEAAPVADREITQLPDFGSRAAGRYRLVTIRGHATQEAIIRRAEEWTADGRPPAIVFFLNVLNVDARRELAHTFGFGAHHPTIVLDEALLVFLSTWPRARLSAFFDCASAFTFAQPFEPDAAEVPPEMFYGRKTERHKILAMSGEMTHFVYGGRRLGKTALLANIAREYRTHAPEQLVLFLDLKGTDIGSRRLPQDLWHFFAEQLAKYKIVSPQTVRHDSIGEGVRKWLGENQDRRILLLVDEADDFLDADRRSEQGYRVLEQIKRLMDETQRRFKVVFAGLHNVQRAARDPNTPLAHLGEPVRIGPMLPETDGAEIENLICGPLEALGYRFESRDSVIRIAAETNYYPALAQQFCKELLRGLRKGGGATDGPPFTILPKAVDRVFDSRETRDRIRNLFAWTIQLDPRYEFLAYLIARESFHNGGSRPQGMPIEDIRGTALREWRKGFSSDPSFLTFEVLLDEMIGLGVLRKAVEGGYTIRTRNLRMLLGNDDEIKRRFDDAKSRMPPAKPDPAQFRRAPDNRLFPITSGQEDRLLSRRSSVGLVFGTRLAGLDQVGDSLKRVAEDRGWPEPLLAEVAVHSAHSLNERLSSASRLRGRLIQIVLVDSRGAWDVARIDDALQFVHGLRAEDRIVRPVFLGGPIEAWAWLNGARPTRRRDIELQEIWLGPCARDFARLWLRGCEAPAFGDLESQDCPADPPWPIVADTAAGPNLPASMADAIDLTLADHPGIVSDVLDLPEAKPVLRVLSEFPDEPMTADFLSDLLPEPSGEMSPENVLRVFDWADRLGLVCKDENGYRLDAAYAAGLKIVFGE